MMNTNITCHIPIHLATSKDAYKCHFEQLPAKHPWSKPSTIPSKHHIYSSLVIVVFTSTTIKNSGQDTLPRNQCDAYGLLQTSHWIMMLESSV